MAGEARKRRGGTPLTRGAAGKLCSRDQGPAAPGLCARPRRFHTGCCGSEIRRQCRAPRQKRVRGRVGRQADGRRSGASRGGSGRPAGWRAPAGRMEPSDAGEKSPLLRGVEGRWAGRGPPEQRSSSPTPGRPPGASQLLLFQPELLSGLTWEEVPLRAVGFAPGQGCTASDALDRLPAGGAARACVSLLPSKLLRA